MDRTNVPTRAEDVARIGPHNSQTARREEVKATAPLSAEQRRLVSENLGLVAVHLRRFVTGASGQRSDREWDDLFQEGCLGLIRAAAEFRPARGIPFAAFALPRIRVAVHRALTAQHKANAIGSLISVLVGERCADSARTASHHPLHGGLAPLRAWRWRTPRRHAVDALREETVGERLRGKYERAVRCAAGEVLSRASIRGDRDRLVRVLTEERYLVPHENEKQSFRKIAAQTRSSYARVVQCDRHLGDAIRRALEVDPEFVQLRRLARTDPRGVEAPIDEALERVLAQVGAEEFLARFRRADDARRTQLMQQLLHLLRDDGDLERSIEAEIRSLPEAMREQLHRASAPEPTGAVRSAF